MNETLTAKDWNACYASTERALRDARHVVEVESRIAAGSAPGHGAAELLVGGERLAQAARVGVFAGSFNPLTLAHAGLAAAARAQLDVFLWALARITVDKERVTRASLADRVVQLQAHGEHSAGADAVVLTDAGLYADQAQAIRRIIAPQAELWLVVGFDKIVQIFDPRYYRDRTQALATLFSAARLLVAPRDQSGEQALEALLARPENHDYADSVRFLKVPMGLAQISSTEARGLAEAPALVAPPLLAGLLPPEGAALALATWAYAPPQCLQDGEVVDRYGLRLALLEVLRPMGSGVLEKVDLGACMEAAAAPTATGARLRRWLRGERWPGGPRDALDLLREVG